MRRSQAVLANRSDPHRVPAVVNSDSTCFARPQRNGNVTSRRLLGAFYTPDHLATVLTRWALVDGPGTVLDPSYGGCAFLRAAVNVLREQRAKHPDRLVFGVDIDRGCVRYAEGLVVSENRITADFLALQPAALSGAPFKAIVGNPPYVRHHWLKGRKRRAAAGVAKRAAIQLPATASTWAYFVVHALDFLAKGGRLALLVPEAILQADYAKTIRAVLQKRFARVVLVHVRDRIFRGTDDPVVVIAAEGVGPGDVRTESVEFAEELAGVLDGSALPLRNREIMSNGREVESQVLDLVQDLSHAPSISTLGHIASIRIGLVTGSNHFFIRSGKDVESRGIPRRALERVVGRTQWLTGLEFTKDDHRLLTELGRRTLLVRPTATTRRHPAIKAWIKEGKRQGVSHHHKCAIREQWFQVDSGPGPDAFVTCTRMGPPFLVLNRAGYRCSNALHALQWRHVALAEAQSVSVAFLSSLTGVWAEIHGRRYGGGVLKLEPGTLRSIPIPLIGSAGDAFHEIDSLLRTGHEERARAAADEAVLRKGLGVSAGDISRLQRALRDLARQRIPTRNGSNGG